MLNDTCISENNENNKILFSIHICNVVLLSNDCILEEPAQYIEGTEEEKDYLRR